MVSIRDGLKELLLHQMYPEHILRDHCHSFGALLGALKEWSAENGEDTVSSLVDSILEKMTKYQAQQHDVVDDDHQDSVMVDTDNIGFDVFIEQNHRELRWRLEFSQRLQSKAMLFAK